ncbi:MAG: trypsin-like peptidase domain-containing protein [Bacteroidetes bacterium]|nr:trypsin-like peptidase domain-containing protein [Bacteroidota bacterium]
MKTILFSGLICLIILIIGCVASPVHLTRQGSLVQFVGGSVRNMKDCSFLGITETNQRGDWGTSWVPAKRAAANSIRNQVADLGGNVSFIVFEEANTFSGKYFVQAEAYRCGTKQKFSNVEEDFEVVEDISSGSGMFVSDDGHILTNYHVVEGCKRLSVGSPPKKVSQIATDPNNDLALLKLESGNNIDQVKFRGEVVSLGEDIITVGFPLSGIIDGLTVTKGEISSSGGIGGDSRHVQISAPVQPGSSGGPLLDKSGRVVGMIFSTLDPIKQVAESGYIPQNVNFAIQNHAIVPFLQLHDVRYKMSDNTTELEAKHIAEEASRFTVKIICSK